MKHAFSKLSKVRCSVPGCGKIIKLRLVEDRSPTNAEVCYEHHRRREALRGHFINHNPRKKRIALGLRVRRFKKEVLQ